MLHFSSPAEVERLRAEHRALYDALAEVMREDDRHHPCDHPHGDACCTHCHARQVLEAYRPAETPGEPVDLLSALYQIRAAHWCLNVALQRGQGVRALSPTDGGGDDERGLLREGGATNLGGAGHADRGRLPGAGMGAGGRVSP